MKNSKYIDSLIKILCLTVLCVGSIVIVGWYMKNTSIVQLHESFAPMQYNTALLFVFSSLAVLLHANKYTILRRLLAILVLILSVATLVQYVANINLGIDLLFVKADFIMTRVSHPGRMGINTAFCFMCVSLSILSSRKYNINKAFALLVLMLSILSLFSYVVREGDTIRGLDSLLQMAVHTGICFLFISFALILNNFSKSEEELNIWNTSPVVVLVSMLLITIFVWIIIKDNVNYNNERGFIITTQERQNAIRDRFNLYEQALLGGVGFFKSSNIPTRATWQKYSEALDMQNYLPGSNGIGYIEQVDEQDLDKFIETARYDGAPQFKNHPATPFKDKFIIKYIEPVNINKAAVGLDIGFEKHRRAAAELSRSNGEIALTKIIFLVQDNKRLAGFLLLAPVYIDNEFKGWVYSPFKARKFLDDFHLLDGAQIGFKVYDGDFDSKSSIDKDKVIYESPNYQVDSQYKHETKLNLAQHIWTICWTATNWYVEENRTILTKVVLIVGTLLSILLSGFFYALSKLYGRTSRESIQSKTRLQTIFKTVAEGIITLDDKGNIESLNPACERLFDYKKDELIGKHISVIIPNLVNIKGNVAKESYGITKNNNRIAIEYSFTLADTTTNRIFTGIIRDITARKHVENLKDQFVSIVSHELRTPLTSINASLGLLKVNLSNSIEKQQALLLDTAYNNCEKLKILINDILDMEKIASGKMTYNIESSDIVALTKTLIKDNLEYANKYSTEFVTEYKVDKVFCNVDNVRFAQIMTNLLSNAAKFSKPGGKVKITIENFDDKVARVYVKDEGYGIPKRFHASLFDSFTQADSVNIRAREGTGLGLNITKTMVDSMGGIIYFTSKENVGTTFYILLPIAEHKASD